MSDPVFVSEHFENISSLISANENRGVNQAFRLELHRASNKSDSDFSGTSSYAEAVELLRTGYHDPLSDIKRKVNIALKNMKTQRSSPCLDIVGHAPCVPNAILGLPQSMHNIERVYRKNKVINIIYEPCASCRTDKETFVKAGVTVLSLINYLETRGYRVSLRMAFFNTETYRFGSDKHDRAFGTVMLKHSRQPLDLLKMTFPLCHPSMLRRIAFRWLETNPEITNREFTRGYGNAVSEMLSYESMRQQLLNEEFISGNEQYINITLCKDVDYDVEALAKRLGFAK